MTKLLFLLIIISCLFSCTETIVEKDALAQDYKYFRIATEDTDGTFKAYKTQRNTNARTLADIVVDCSLPCVSVTELNADTLLIKLCVQDNKGLLYPSSLGSGIVVDNCKEYCTWLVPAADFLPKNDLGYWWFTVGNGSQADTYYFNEDALVCTPLPLGFLSMDIVKSGENYQFKIRVENQYNIQHVILQGSNDAINWVDLVTWIPKGSAAIYIVWYIRNDAPVPSVKIQLYDS